MRKPLLSLLIILSFVGYGQNWNVFNKGYRYNYKFDNSQLVSNVLFSGTVSIVGADTVYNLNKIGVITGSVLTGNQPQFLRHNLVKKADGSVKLNTPGNITILPTCTLNQTWLFDSNMNYSATCVAISTISIFSVVDSLKIVIVNNTDSVLLSKQFGIIMYPFNYAQNKYYRLVGIENKASYDLNALYGEKVPNAWDFYDHFIGQMWCSDMKYYGGMQSLQSCEKATCAIKSKTVTASHYIYNVDKNFYAAPFYSGCWSPGSMTFTNINIQYPDPWVSGGLISTTLDENIMYPGMVYNIAYGYNLVRLGTDNLGRVYKYVGPSCASWSVTMPNQNEPVGFSQVSPDTYTMGVQPQFQSPGSSILFGVGLGKLGSIENALSSYHYCKTCYGTVNTAVHSKSVSFDVIFPNPANAQLNFPVNNGKVKVFDHLGKLVKDEMLFEKSTMDISNLPNGLYLVEIQTDSFRSSQKLIIQH